MSVWVKFEEQFDLLVDSFRDVLDDHVKLKAERDQLKRERDAAVGALTVVRDALDANAEHTAECDEQWDCAAMPCNCYLADIRAAIAQADSTISASSPASAPGSAPE